MPALHVSQSLVVDPFDNNEDDALRSEIGRLRQALESERAARDISAKAWGDILGKSSANSCADLNKRASRKTRDPVPSTFVRRAGPRCPLSFTLPPTPSTPSRTPSPVRRHRSPSPVKWRNQSLKGRMLAAGLDPHGW
jgi:hypothetical protein